MPACCLVGVAGDEGGLDEEGCCFREGEGWGWWVIEEGGEVEVG